MSMSSAGFGNNIWILVMYLAEGFAVSAVLEALLLPMLRRLKAGQSIREEGPQSHQVKSGTPTMGGLAMLAAFLVMGIVICLVTKSLNYQTLSVVLVTLGYGVIGFIDDYIKVVKKRNLGLNEKQKILGQLLVGIAFGFARYYCGGPQASRVWIPFINKNVDFGFWIIPFTVFVLVAMTNAVNLTDGLDGLASSTSSIVCATLAVICMSFGNYFAPALLAALCGICLGFLVWNHHPAKVFMGDTGSLALGGGIASAAMVCGFDFLLPIAGLLYVIEALSVIIQVVVFKTQNGRRFFRMAPIHHHFELGGWKETKVVRVFCLATLVFCALAAAAAYL